MVQWHVSCGGSGRLLAPVERGRGSLGGGGLRLAGRGREWGVRRQSWGRASGREVSLGGSTRLRGARARSPAQGSELHAFPASGVVAPRLMATELCPACAIASLAQHPAGERRGIALFRFKPERHDVRLAVPLTRGRLASWRAQSTTVQRNLHRPRQRQRGRCQRGRVHVNVGS